MKIYRIVFIIISIVLYNVSSNSEAKAEDLKSALNLSGLWKFSIGDNLDWADPVFNDANWEDISVPRSWERDGYEGYNGYAWYRTSFTLNHDLNSKYVYLKLGYIDDVDEVYLNGKLIAGSGQFPPQFESAFEVQRKYPIPIELIKENQKNTLAIRVYDHYENGGIVNGDVGLFLDRHERLLDLNLSGYWNFETEDELQERKKLGESKVKNKVFVPGTWESNGYPNFDGKARYSTKFEISKELLNEDLYLILGYVDDVETVYINGQKIGSVISLEKKEKTGLPYYIIFRGYKIPEGLLQLDKPNQLSVIVYDHSGLGGIYYGPVGITNYEDYETLKQLNTRRRGFWELFFN